MELVIGNKNYSSWSLRPWLLLAVNEIPFTETRISLFTDNTDAELKKHTEANKVPVLHDRGLTVWDSLAICETISERYLEGRGWPQEMEARAAARSCCAEMHSGFEAIRGAMPMNCRATHRKVTITAELEKEVARIDALWSGLRAKYAGDGSWLFGEFSIADCMFAPVVFRFATYDVAVSEPSKQYMDSLLAHPKIQLWVKAAIDEVEVIDVAEVGV